MLRYGLSIKTTEFSFMTVHHLPVRIYYEDTDAGGIVYHARYLAFCERARTEILRQKNIHQVELLQQNLGFVVAKLNIHYKNPAFLDDLLDVQTELTTIKAASFGFSHHVVNQNNQLICSIEVVIAVIDTQKKSAARIPTFISLQLKSESDHSK